MTEWKRQWGGDKSVAKTLTTFAGRNDYNCNYVKIEKIGETKDKGKYSCRTDDIGSGGSTPTLTATDYKHPILVGSKGIPIKEATKQGYAIAEGGDGVYISHLKGKRGTVQKNKIQTIKTTPDVGVVVNGKRKESDNIGQGDSCGDGVKTADN